MNDTTTRAADAISEAFQDGHDAAEFVAHALCTAAAEAGGTEELLRNQPGSWEAALVRLPPLGWSLATNGNLIGTADSLSYTPEQQRAAVKQWADHVGVPVDTDRMDASGREELYAGWKDDERRTRGCFRATIFLNTNGS